MKQSINIILRLFASIECTLFCLALMMILTTAGTLAQAGMGAFAAQSEFFNRFWVWLPLGGVELPVFPGGLSIGILWLLSLCSAFVVRFKLDLRQSGLYLSHLGIILLLLGQVITQLMAVETQLSVEVGQTVNYSESSREHELAIIRRDLPDSDLVVSIPASGLVPETVITHQDLPFSLKTRAFFANSDLRQAGEVKSLATQGMGTGIAVKALPVTRRDDERNILSAYIQIDHQGQDAGTWLVSSALGNPQTFSIAGGQYEIYLRQKRSYYPFSLTLDKFTHDVYPGTQIPRNFASTVRINNPEKNESREALIYMNHPLRYEGLTFYQASYGKNDTLSILQVVRNPVWLTPYLSCILVTLGLLLHFAMRFLSSQVKQ